LRYPLCSSIRTPAANHLVVESVAKNPVGGDGEAIRARLNTVL
jgi:hypothetical protein